MSVRDILLAASTGTRITSDNAVTLLQNAQLPELAWAADAACALKHPENIRTYVIDRNINYTNICISGCRFCAFYRKPGDTGCYVLSNEQILKKIAEAVDMGATQILMQGGLHPDLDIAYFEKLLSEIKQMFNVQVHSLSAPEIVHISRVSGLNIRETLRKLHKAGLDSLPGGGAEMLVEGVRSRVSPHKCGVNEWLDVMRLASELGMRATATMVFGMGESIADRVSHMEKIRKLQGETGVFTAFIPWTFQPGNTDLGGEAAGGHDYLRTLAVSRLYLDNIENIQASWVTQGSAIAQLSLRFGANDIGSTMIEENVVAAAGVSHRMSENDLIRMIHNAGYDAAQRTTLYEPIRKYQRQETA